MHHKKGTCIRLALVAAGVSAALLLSGCATLARHFRGEDAPQTTRPAATAVSLDADWHWSVTGDAAIRPIQVFSIRNKTYLQMRAGQLIPAVLINNRPVPYALQNPYIVVDGTPDRLDLLAQGYRALILHQGTATMPADPVPASVTSAAAAAPVPPTIEPGYAVVRRAPVVPAAINPEIAKLASNGTASQVWALSASPGGSTTLESALREMLRAHGYDMHWGSPINQSLRSDFSVTAPDVYGAVGQVLGAASPAGWRYFFTVSNTTVYVTASRAN